jgi:hypothetical protein
MRKGVQLGYWALCGFYVILIGFCGLVGLLALALLGYHTFLIGIQQTTKERLKGVFWNEINPYGKIFGGNWKIKNGAAMSPASFSGKKDSR